MQHSSEYLSSIAPSHPSQSYAITALLVKPAVAPILLLGSDVKPAVDPIRIKEMDVKPELRPVVIKGLVGEPVPAPTEISNEFQRREF